MSSHDRDELQAWLRSQATPGLLSSLVFATEEASLKRFGRRVSQVPLSGEQLELLQRLATAICCAVHSEQADDWKAIASAVDTLRRLRPPPPLDAKYAGPEPLTTARRRQTHPYTVATAPSPLPATTATAQPRPGRNETLTSIPAESAVAAAAASPPLTEQATTFDPVSAAETEAIDLAAVAKLMADNPSATPFATSPSGSHSAGSKPPPPSPSLAPHPQAGATEGIDEAAIQAAIAGSYPLPAASLDRLPLPLDRYGALVARSEAARDVAQLSALYAEYGVQDTAHRTRVDEEYRAVFEQHPELRSAFDDVVAQWRAYLRRV